MSNTNEPGLRPGPVEQPPTVGSSPGTVPESQADIERRRLADEAAVAAYHQERRVQDFVSRYGARFGANPSLAPLFGNFEPKDRSIQPAECWRIRQPVGRF